MSTDNLNAESFKDDYDKWTLASDMKLLLYIQKISTEFNLKSKETFDKVEDLAINMTDTEVKLRNTLNDFLMLANTQFMENVSENFLKVIINNFII